MDQVEAIELLAYDRWANRRLFDHAAGPGDLTTSGWRLLGHIIAVQELWMSRITGTADEHWDPFPQIQGNQLALRCQAIAGLWQRHVERLDGGILIQPVSFRDTRGNPQSDRHDHILRHLVNHGTHHRGQMAALLRAADQDPPALDYIAFCRVQARAMESPATGTGRLTR